MFVTSYQQLEQLVYEKMGLKIDPERRKDIEEIIASIESELPRSEHILDVLYHSNIHDPIWQPLINRITVGETYFFRNRYHFHALRYSVLPEIIQKRRIADYKYINIWSAGCSTGEEPYSLAILLHELIPDIQNWTITILATDVKQASLDVAQRGCYRSISFRSETPEYLKSRYFTEKNGMYELDESIREMVTFKPLNLITDTYPSFATRTMHQDIVICRNVTIYFDEQTTSRVIRQFYEALSPEGWLVVGHAEPSMTNYQAFHTRNYENAIFYQKPVIHEPIEVSRPIIVKPIAQAPEPEPEAPVTLDEINQVINRKDWDLAKALLRKLEVIQPSDAMTHYLTGVIAMQSEDLVGAYAAMRRAIYCDPKFFMAHFAMGEIHMKLNEHDAAQQCWRKANQLMNEPDESINKTSQA